MVVSWLTGAKRTSRYESINVGGGGEVVDSCEQLTENQESATRETRSEQWARSRTWKNKEYCRIGTYSITQRRR